MKNITTYSLEEREKNNAVIRIKIKEEVEKLSRLNISPFILGLGIKDKILNFIIRLIHNRNLETSDTQNLLNKENCYYYKKKKLFFSQEEWQEIEKYKKQVIEETLLYEKKLDYKSKLNITEAKQISIKLSEMMKDTKILKYIDPLIKIDKIILSELAREVVKNSAEEIERYMLERKLSHKIIMELESSLSEAAKTKLEKVLTKSAILELLSNEEITSKSNHMLIITSLLVLTNIFYSKNKKYSKIIEEILESKKCQLTAVIKILLNKLSYYKRIIGHEIIEILLMTGYIEQFSYNKKNKRVIIIKYLIPSVIINLATDMPNLLKNFNNETTMLFSGAEEIVIQNKYHFKYDSFSKGKVNKNRVNELNFQYNAAYELDLDNVLNLLENLNKILSKNLNLDDQDLYFLSHFYKYNFFGLKATMTTKEFESVLKLATDFVNPMEENLTPDEIKKLSFRKKFLRKINNKINGIKYIYYDIFLNITTLLDFSNFYFNYFQDFRGRNYPIPAFSYLSPNVRNFISFKYDKNIDINAFNTCYKNEVYESTITLILEQLKSNFIIYDSKIEALYKTNELITNEALFKFNIKLNSLYTIKKILVDLQNIYLNKKNKGFTSFYSLDSSSSGSQILSILLRDKSLAQGCSINLNDSNKESLDIYTVITESIKNEFENVVIPTYNLLMDNNILPPLKSTFLIKEEEKNDNKIYLKYLLSLVSNVKITNEDIIPVMRDLNDTFAYIVSLQDRKILEEYLLQYFEKKKIKIITQKLLMGSEYIFLDLKNLYERIYMEETTPIDEKSFYKIINGFFVLKLVLIMIKLQDIVGCYRKFGITKKIVKSPTMTSLYGSTIFGQQNQIMDVLLEQCINEGISITMNSYREMSRYTLYTIFIIRKIMKILIMTTPYASTNFGNELVLQENIIDYCLKKGKIFNNEQVKKFKKLAKAIVKIFFIWKEMNLFPAMKLLHVTKILCKQKEWKIF